MTTPRRFAALAVCLLALAAGAAAQTCTAGSIKMALVSADAGVVGSDIATCLSSATLSIAGDCKLSIAAATDNAFVPAMWSSDTNSYKQYKLCPSSSSKAVSDASMANALILAFNGYVYGFNDAGTSALKGSGVTGVTFPQPGQVQIAIGSANLVYAIQDATTATSIDPNAVVSTGAGFTANTEYKDADNVGFACGAGRYGMPVGDIKLCPLCPAGTSGDGDGCTACSAGYAYGSVGLSSAGSGCDIVGNQCAAGYYAQEGSSTCLPCPMHTYTSTAGKGECTPCPANTYAWIPGSTTCMYCNDGVPTATTDAQANAGTAGSAILKLPAKLVCGDHTGSYAINALDQCGSWNSAIGVPTTKLALEVAGDCSITIKPIGDDTCSDPGAVSGETKLYPLNVGETYGYTYNALLMRAYYASATSIRSLLPSDDGGASSYMINIDLKDDVAKTVDLTFYAATNEPDGVDPASTTCTQVATVEGKLANITAACTAGAYGSTSCYACPAGYTCTGGTNKVECAAESANPFLGMTNAVGFQCLTCNVDISRVTSLAGAAYCTIPYFDRQCDTNVTINSVTYNYALGGYEWDESAGACVQCRPGTYRSLQHLANGVADCQECAKGTYSGAGASACTPCPAGQYSPTTGLADQATAANPKVHCLRCPVGSIALATGDVLKDDNSLVTAAEMRNGANLNVGADRCESCPQGTYAAADTIALPTNDNATQADQNAKACTLCPAGTYRIGDAAAQNNVCKKIPAGYRASSLLYDSGKSGAYAIAACSIGEVSYWTKSGASETRTPDAATKADECLPCADENSGNSNTYAPRTGMAACLACKGGFEPNDAHTSCDQCAIGYYRSFYTKAENCTSCPAGSEVGPSGRQACTLCRPGSYKTTAATTDFCSECPINTYMPAPGASAAVGVANGCTFCPKGTETQDKGNTECTPCSVGYYNPKAADATNTLDNSTPACIKAPAGTYVNTTGAFFATQCPLGTYNPDTAQDSCEPCPPGQYANTLGNKVCKTCPAGTYSGGQASTCKACAPGFYSPAGSGACSPCKPGTYSNAARAGTCALCPKGFQCPTPATTAPKACPAGTYSAKDGSSLCTPCPVNTFAGSTQSTKCAACAKGTNTRGLTGQKACQAVRVTTLRRSVL